MSKVVRTYPVSLVEHLTGQAVSSGSGKAGRGGHKALVHDGELEEVLGDSTSLQVVLISLADAAKKAHRARPSEIEVEDGEHEALGLQNFVNGVAAIDHVDNLLDGRRSDLFILGSDKDGSSTDQLQLSEGDDLVGEEPVNVVDAEKQGLREQSKAEVHLDQPVHQHRSHRPLDLGLVGHVVGHRQHSNLGEKLVFRWQS